MRELSSQSRRQCVVGEEFNGQRLDNYLLREWRGVPRALVYRLIRSGHVRVNAARARPHRRLHAGDTLHLPASVSVPRAPPPARAAPLTLPPLYEDAQLLAVDKPAGLAVHGGSGLAHGVIERLRAARPPHAFLELAHRLDRDTSGVLLLVKKRAALAAVQQQWRARLVKKRYAALVFGEWRAAQHRRINLPLKRLPGGEGTARQVVVNADGKSAATRTALIGQKKRGALIEADIQTGRTHQLRVHFSAAAIPIVGDDKYGDFAANRAAAAAGHARLFLHAMRLQFVHPQTQQTLVLESPPPPAFHAAAAWLDQEEAA